MKVLLFFKSNNFFKKNRLHVTTLDITLKVISISCREVQTDVTMSNDALNGYLYHVAT